MECEKTGKIAHSTRDAALDHQKALVYKNHVQGESEKSHGLNVYPCDSCGSWHVGHRDDVLPLVWHYTVVHELDAILASDCLRPPTPHVMLPDDVPDEVRRTYPDLSMPLSKTMVTALRAQLGNRKSPALVTMRLSVMAGRRRLDVRLQVHSNCIVLDPLLWFSRNAEWEHSVIKALPNPGRAQNEVVGQGLLRFQLPASVAKLRWSDYLERNPMTSELRDGMAQGGNPVEWLATDDAIALDDAQRYRSFAIQVYYRGQWVSVKDVVDEDFDRYLAERPDAYESARTTLNEKLATLDGHAAIAKLSPRLRDQKAALIEALAQEMKLTADERIVFEDWVYGLREEPSAR